MRKDWYHHVRWTDLLPQTFKEWLASGITAIFFYLFLIVMFSFA